VRLKYNPLAVVSGKRVVVVDDSIVRGTTMRQLAAMLREAGATEVHIRVSSPPIVSPCFYGIDFGDDRQLVAAGQTIEETRRQIGATTLAHLSLEGVQRATTRPGAEFCRACFTREYPTRVPAGRTLAKFRFEPAGVSN
jgi:amidophosphoribosyltransferase